jgi:DNA-binding SARP family transcriptional activator
MLLVALSCWLGLSLLVRAPNDQSTRVFAWFCLHMALYGLSNLLPQLTASQAAAHLLNRFQLITTVLVPAVFLHFIAMLTTSGCMTRPQRILVQIFYGTGVLLALYAAVGPLPAPVAPFPPWSRWGEPRFPEGVLVWAWVLQRVVPLVSVLVLLAMAYRLPAHDVQQRRLRLIYGIIGLVGVVGALAATFVRDLPISPAVPRTLMLAAMFALAYAVLVHRALLPERVARRTFFYSILGSLATTLYIGLVLGLEWLVSTWLQIDVPLVTAFSLVALVAILEPLRESLRRHLDRHFYRREFNYVSLVRSLGDEMIEQGDLSDQAQAALSAICRALGVQQGLVAVASSPGLVVQAVYGKVEPLPHLQPEHVPDEPQWLDEQWVPWPPAHLLFPLRQGEERLGLLLLGEQYVPQPFGKSEYALLDYLNSYLCLSISHAHARELQQDVILALAEQSRALRDQQEQLARQARVTAQEEFARQERSPHTGKGLHVYALGPLRVERDGETITRWGGSKAGTYQAEALFAFLFDRRGKGVSKDEVAEVIWPDLEIDKSDGAFHRTLAALRRTLEPNLRRGNLSKAILYHHERYWLEPDFVVWCDIEAFLAAAERGLTRLRQDSSQQALVDLEYADDLYRGDYMDDCPFFGDSAYVEEQRAVLRACYVDVQLALGVAYEAQGKAGEATSAYRRALALNPDGCPSAVQALERLQVVT